MGSYGKQTLTSVGRGIRCSADGAPLSKIGGVTIDWTTVAAASSSDVTLDDGSIVPAYSQYLRYGQVLTQIGIGEVQTITFTGGPTAGSAIITFPASGTESAQTAAAVAFDASAATMQAALEALSRIGPGGVSVARSGSGSAGSPYVYTITFDATKGNVPQFTSTHTFTGGTSPTTTHGTTTAGTTGGKYGPYDPAASDGRQTIARDSTFIVDQTILSTDRESDHPPVIYGGDVFRQRIIATGGTASLAAGPTWSNLQTALPMLQATRD